MCGVQQVTEKRNVTELCPGCSFKLIHPGAGECFVCGWRDVPPEIVKPAWRVRHDRRKPSDWIICHDALVLIDRAVASGTMTEMEGGVAKFKICRQRGLAYPLRSPLAEESHA